MQSILLLDNHDSFTWNLVELLRSTGKVKVKIITPETLPEEVLADYDRILFSPGPGLPQEQPAMFGVLDRLESQTIAGFRCVPVLGVCLGLQAIALHFGAALYNLETVVHGRPGTLRILLPEHPLFAGIPDGTPAGLYHSWAVDPATLPDCLEILALSEEGVIMAIAHKTLPVLGVQFHPESIMTPKGRKMVENWLETG